MKIVNSTLDLKPEFDIRSICSPEEMLLFDIETTGLKKETTQLYLIGCAYFEQGQWKIRQWLTENTTDEELVLELFMDFASSFSTLVHFNGDGFDLPYLRYKAQLYGTGDTLSALTSFDIYKQVKKARKLLQLTSMSQKSLEQFLGIDREDQMNGGTLIPVYYQYEKTGAQDAESLLLLHNYDDIQGMLKILSVLSYSAVFDGKYEFLQLSRTADTAVFEYRLQNRVPVQAETFGSAADPQDLRICVNGNLLQISVRIRTGTGKIPLENVDDYYYLPAQDCVIHKDVAGFIEKSRRKKATKKNCFLKKEGQFVPADHFDTGALYFMEGIPKQTFVLWEELLEKNNGELSSVFAKDMLGRILSC